jgi:transcriptional regulator with XRE-family HTH domain
MMQGWAKRVRQARLAAGLETQEDLESSLGMSPRTVSTWERGIQMCHPTDMYRLAKLLGVTMDWLVGGDEAFLTLEAKRRLAAITV